MSLMTTVWMDKGVPGSRSTGPEKKVVLCKVEL